MSMDGFSLQNIVDLFRFGGHTNELHQSLLTLGMLIIVAKLAEGAFRRLRLNAIIAYAATGMFLGPVLELTGVWWIDSSLHLQLVLALGVFIFFFLIGLDEVDISSFMASLRGHYFLAAVLSVIVSLSISMLVTTDLVFDFGLKLNFTESLALAGVLSMTSLGIVAKVLTDGGYLKQPVGLQIFTVVIIAELIALLLIGFSIGEHAHQVSPVGILILLGKVAGFSVVTWVLSSRVLPPLVALLQRVIQVPQLSLGLLLGMLFLIVYCAEAVGLHGSLGALLFGASLSNLPYQVHREIIPGIRSVAEGFFVPLFFASAGLSFSFTFVTLPLGAMAGLALIPLLGNFTGAFIGAYVSRLAVPYAVATGPLLLVMWGSGIIDEVVFSFLVLVMFCYILFMPSVINFAVSRASRRTDLPAQLDDIPSGIVRFALEDIRIDDILDRSHPHPSSSVTVRDFTEQWIVPRQPHYVVADKEALVGIVSLEMLRYLPKEAWDKTRLDAVVRRQTPLAWPDEQVEDVLQRMSESSLSVMPVVERESEKFLGAVTNNDIIQLMTRNY
ncbi:MAG: cation:proton antiporter [Candidatus Latescibacteria bacterium]|nr:cation:proton antiporter [Candidatus Latescibacterota bacterium]